MNQEATTSHDLSHRAFDRPLPRRRWPIVLCITAAAIFVVSQLTRREEPVVASVTSLDSVVRVTQAPRVDRSVKRPAPTPTLTRVEAAGSIERASPRPVKRAAAPVADVRRSNVTLRSAYDALLRDYAMRYDDRAAEQALRAEQASWLIARDRACRADAACVAARNARRAAELRARVRR